MGQKRQSDLFLMGYAYLILHNGLSHCTRKPTKYLGENKGADQLRGNREADQRLCFRYMDSTIPLLLISENFKLLACFCDCTDWFVSDLVETTNCWFSHAQALLMLSLIRLRKIIRINTARLSPLDHSNFCHRYLLCKRLHIFFLYAKFK